MTDFIMDTTVVTPVGITPSAASVSESVVATTPNPFLHLLGYGSFSNVYQVTQNDCSLFHTTINYDHNDQMPPITPDEERPTPGPEVKLYALKYMKQEHAHCAEYEIAALQQIGRHPNIISLVRVFSNCKVHGDKALLLEHAPGGDLFTYLEKNKRIQDKNVVRAYFRQLLSALQAAHDKNVYHRDIKLENLFIGDKGQLLVGDWGLSTVSTSGVCPHSSVGTYPYMAPEVLERIHGCSYSLAAADTWAAVCILFNMVSGHPPFRRASMADDHFNCLKKNPAKYWNYLFGKGKELDDLFEPELRSLIESVFMKNATSRPTVSKLLFHPWLTQPTNGANK